MHKLVARFAWVFVISCVVMIGHANAAETAVTLGGDNGRAIEVTSLEDSGPGTLRAALEASGPRRIVFRVAGNIWLGRPITIREPFVTISGETAPSPGITLKGQSLRIRKHDVIVRHLRIHVGEIVGDRKELQNRDGISIDGSKDGQKPAERVIIENCSVLWAVDEGLAVWGENSNHIVVRNTIVGEGLRFSKHPKGQHSTGVLIGPNTHNILLERNLFIHNALRNPAIWGGASAAVINNVVYNPRGAALHFYSNPNTPPMLVAAIGNAIIAGPDTRPRLRSFDHGLNAGSRLYFNDNLVSGTVAFDRSEKIDWSRGRFATAPEDQFEMPTYVDSAPVAIPPNILPANETVAKVLESVGARPWDRDQADRRLISEVLSKTGGLKDYPTDPALRDASMRGRNLPSVDEPADSQ